MGVMKLILQHPASRCLKKPIVVFALCTCWQRCFSTSTTHEGDPSSSTNARKKVPSLEIMDYLVTSCGLPSEEAAGICSKLSNSANVRRAEKVISFLKESGFEDTEIRKTINACPNFLSSSLEKTLIPKVRAFQESGLSGPHLARLVASNPIVLGMSLTKKITPIIGIFTSSLRDEEDVARGIRRFFSRYFSSNDIVKKMAINLATLRSRGVSDRSLSKLLVTRPTLFALKLGSLLAMVDRAHELGFDYSSTMFHRALFVVSSMNKSIWDAKVDILNNNGWNQDEITLAIRKEPSFMRLSRSNLQKKLHFFMRVLKYKPAELAMTPCILMFSMEKRVIPRVTVVNMLNSANIPKKNRNLLTVLQMKENVFYEEYVLKYMDECPDVLQAYRNHMKASLV
ncbi:unnamed protein product [Victoria cruziana]